jgi:hypothetical protein
LRRSTPYSPPSTVPSPARRASRATGIAFRSLFVPGARLIPTFKQPTGEIATRVLTPEEFITSSGKFMEEQGFFERSIANHVETFGNIAQVFSVYEGTPRHGRPEALRARHQQHSTHERRQALVDSDDLLAAEDAANPLPKKYLTARKN